MKEVIIKIRGTQGLGDDKSAIELSSEGTLTREGEKYILSYNEDTVVEGGNIRTRLTAEDGGKITLERSGAISSKLYIQKGVRNNCFYSVPEGNLTLGIYGKEVSVNLDDTGGTIEMTYTLDANMKLISENTVLINVKER